MDLLWNSSPNVLKTLIASVALYATWKLAQKRLTDQPSDSSKCSNTSCKCLKQRRKLKLLFGSKNGKSEMLCRRCFDLLRNDCQIKALYEIECHPINDYDPEDEILVDANLESFLVIFMPTFSHGEPPENARWFCKWISEAANDFRFASDSLKKLNFALFGIGDSSYGADFCLLARNLNTWFEKLQAKRFHPTHLLDTNHNQAIDEQFEKWIQLLSRSLTRSNNVSTVEDDLGDEFEEEEDIISEQGDVVDLEDIVKSKPNGKSSKKIVDMITPQIRKELTKQGYKLIGSHSGVKLCRWTKSMLRGRGKTITRLKKDLKYPS